MTGDRLEISLHATSAHCDSLCLQFRRSPDGAQYTQLVYDYRSGSLRLTRDQSTNTAEVTLDPCEYALNLADGEALNLTIYLDNSVIEIYANGRLSMTSRIYPSRDDAGGLRLSAQGRYGDRAADRLADGQYLGIRSWLADFAHGTRPFSWHR